MEKPSILFGIPHRGDLIDARFDVSLLATIFDLAAAGINVEVKKAWGRRETLDRVRNLIVRYFLEKTKHTHLFFLDDDVLLLKHTIPKLLAHDLPIISGLYRERGQKHRPLLIYTPKGGDGRMTFEMRPFDKIKNSDLTGPSLVRVDAVPAGCLLIQRTVLEKLKPPWFYFPGKHVGEDVYFSLHAAKVGYKMFVDTRAEALHVVTHVAGSEEAIGAWEHEFGFEESDTIRS
jgi:GT2 family glycosyltransferase